MNQREIVSNTSIKNSIEKRKKIKLNYLTNLKPKESLSKSNDELLDTKIMKLKANLDSFQKAFYDFNKNFKKTLNKIRNNNFHNNFSKYYNKIKNHNLFKRKELLDDIKQQYNKKNMSLPVLQNKGGTKNLFTKNLILSGGKDIRKFISNNFLNESSKNKSILYFKKIEDNIHRDYLKRINPDFKEVKDENEQMKKDESDLIKVNFKKRYSIVNDEYLTKSMNDINKISDTLNNIQDIDFFFESDNQNYFKYLKGDTSKNNSNYSTKDKNDCPLFRLVNVRNEINKNKKEINKNKRYKSFSIPEPKKGIVTRNRKSYFNLNSSIFNTFKKDMNRNKTLIIKKIKANNCKNSVINIEKLYNKIKDSNDLEKSNKLIENYLSNKKYNNAIKIFPIDLYKHYKVTRNRILKSNFYKRNTKLKYKSGLRIKKNENVLREERWNELRVKSMDDKMEELIGKFN